MTTRPSSGQPDGVSRSRLSCRDAANLEQTRSRSRSTRPVDFGGPIDSRSQIAAGSLQANRLAALERARRGLAALDQLNDVSLGQGKRRRLICGPRSTLGRERASSASSSAEPRPSSTSRPGHSGVPRHFASCRSRSTAEQRSRWRGNGPSECLAEVGDALVPGVHECDTATLVLLVGGEVAGQG